MLLTSSIYAFISALWTSSKPSLKEWPWETKHPLKSSPLLLLSTAVGDCSQLRTYKALIQPTNAPLLWWIALLAQVLTPPDSPHGWKEFYLQTEIKHNVHKAINTKSMKGTGATAHRLTWRGHVFCICSVHHLHRKTAHPEVGLHRRETRPVSLHKPWEDASNPKHMKTFHGDIVGLLQKAFTKVEWTKTLPGQQEKRRSLTAEPDLLGEKRRNAYKGWIKPEWWLQLFYWQLINGQTLQRLI